MRAPDQYPSAGVLQRRRGFYAHRERGPLRSRGKVLCFARHAPESKRLELRGDRLWCIALMSNAIARLMTASFIRGPRPTVVRSHRAVRRPATIRREGKGRAAILRASGDEPPETRWRTELTHLQRIKAKAFLDPCRSELWKLAIMAIADAIAILFVVESEERAFALVGRRLRPLRSSVVIRKANAPEAAELERDWIREIIRVERVKLAAVTDRFDSARRKSALLELAHAAVSLLVCSVRDEEAALIAAIEALA